MTRLVHAECEILYGTLFQPLCQNNAECDAFEDIGLPVSMSPDDADVTCPACLQALGYEIDAAKMRDAA